MDMNAAVKIAATVTGQSAVDGLKKSLDGVSNGVEGVTGKFAALGGSVKMLAGAVGVLGFAAMVKEVINAGDEMYKLSQKTGVSVEALSTFKAAGKLADVSLEELGKAFVKFDVSMSKATTGSKEAAGAFKAIGISVATLKGAKPEEAMLKVADAFSKVPDGADKTRVAVELFGKAGAGMIPLLNQGSQAIEAMGVKMTTDFASRAEAFNDSLTIMGSKAKIFAMQAADAMLPTLQAIMSGVLNVASTKPNFVGFFDAVAEAARLFAVVLSTAWTAIANISDTGITLGKQAVAFATGDFARIDQLEAEYVQRRKDRIADMAAFNSRMLKNSLVFGEGTVDEIKNRQREETAVPKLARTGKIDSTSLDRSGDADVKKLENAIKQYEKETEKIEAETRALGENALVKKEILALQDLEAKGIKEGTKAYTRLAEERKAALKEQYETERSYNIGVKSFMNEYVDVATNSGKQIKDALSNAFKGAENALVDFVVTGKSSFGSLATSIIKDLVRIAIQRTIMAPLAGFMGSFLPNADGNVFSGGSVQKFATGGVFDSPHIFPMANGGIGLLGEAGPEAVMPLSRGADGKLGVKAAGGGGVNVTVNVDASNNASVNGDDTKSSQLGRVISDAIKAELIKQKRPGGLLAA